MRPRFPQPIMMKIKRILRFVLRYPSRLDELQRVARYLHRCAQSRRWIVNFRGTRRGHGGMRPKRLLLQDRRVTHGERCRRQRVHVRQRFGVLHYATGELVASLGEGKVGHFLLARFEDSVAAAGSGGCGGTGVGIGGGRAGIDAQCRGGQFFFHGGRVAFRSGPSSSSGRCGVVLLSSVARLGRRAATRACGDGHNFYFTMDQVV
mmetsp:Transcript_4701/g.10371  ORF Transcript_4701/g.10371 Transcript_4701/m.10371 type:complete len:206 (+) Transcript_4701:2695-3312(+)